MQLEGQAIRETSPALFFSAVASVLAKKCPVAGAEAVKFGFGAGRPPRLAWACVRRLAPWDWPTEACPPSLTPVCRRVPPNRAGWFDTASYSASSPALAFPRKPTIIGIVAF